MATEISFDVNTITLGEALDVEKQSGEEFADLIRSRMGQRMIALYLHERRNSERPRSWHELLSLRILDSKLSTSPSASNGHHQKSSDSPSET